MERVYIKHQGSCLSDQWIDIDIDHERREVQLTMAVFDSALVAEVAKTVLPLPEYGAQVLRDDNQVETFARVVWVTRPAEYSLNINVAGVRFASAVVKLISGEIAVTLAPIR